MYVILLLVAMCVSPSAGNDETAAANGDIVAVIKKMQKDIEVNRKFMQDIAQLVRKHDSTLEAVKNLTKNVQDIKGILTAVLPGKTRQTAAQSCAWLEDHYYGLRNGHYWTLSGGKPKYNYCRMGEEPGTKENPGVSCKELKENYPGLKSRTYWIQLTEPTEMYCDMDTGQGGWTMVARATVESEDEVAEVDYRKIVSDNTSRLSDVSKGRFLLGARGLRDLQKHISFSSIRWHCYKPWHGRTVHIYTKNTTVGNEVVEWMLERIPLENHPASCGGSYSPLENDDSVIGRHCEKWKNQRWGAGSWISGKGVENKRLYAEPMYIHHKNTFLLYGGNSAGDLNCDDEGDESNFSPIGEWMVYVK